MILIQVLWYNYLVIARQNVQIASILTDFRLGSRKDFDAALPLIGSKRNDLDNLFRTIDDTFQEVQ